MAALASTLKKDAGIYMLTARTVEKQPFFSSPERLDLLQDHILQISSEFGWMLQAWAVFPNHYHLIAQSPAQSGDIRRMITKLHANTARAVNKFDNAAGRMVWFQFWDTPITFANSYYARLNYVHHNPVRHGCTTNPEDYKWCSASWFLKSASPSYAATVLSFPYDKLDIPDDF